MKAKNFLFGIVSLFLPVCLLAQIEICEDKYTKRITEETFFPEGKIVTTTVIEKQSVFTNGFWYNWEVTADVGPHLYYGDNDWKVAKKREMIAFPAIDLYMTKWVSPSFGMGFGVTTARFKGLYQSRIKDWGPNSLGANFQTQELYTRADPKYDYMKLAYQGGWFTNIYGVFHVDWGNLFAGYDPYRFFTVDSYIGGGLIMGYDSGNRNKLIPSATANIGFINRFRVTDNLQLVVNIRGALVSDDFDGELYVQEPNQEHWDVNNRMDGNAGITFGLCFTIGKERNRWRTASRTSQVYYADPEKTKRRTEETEIAGVRIPGMDSRSNNAKDEKNGMVQVAKTDTVFVSNIPEVWFHINFIIDRWDLLSREMVNLNAVADLIKSTPDVRYLICGYADKQTATPEHNRMLSENRSKAVFDALVNVFGVNPDQLVRDFKGGVDYMFYNEKELSRCVMITAIHE